MELNINSGIYLSWLWRTWAWLSTGFDFSCMIKWTTTILLRIAVVF